MSKDHTKLKERFSSILKKRGGDEQKIEKWWKIIEDFHSEKHRSYHTLNHVQDMLQKLDEVPENLIKNKEIIELSTYFHDIIYNPKSNQNEEDSAKVFEDFASDIIVFDETNIKQAVTNFILMTKNHKITDFSDPDLMLFLDLDMSILGSPDLSTYIHYSKCVRQEYIHVADPIFVEKRSEFLRKTASEGPIFVTNYCQSKFQPFVNRNFEQEIHELQKISK